MVGKSADSLQNQTGGWSLTWQGTGNTNADFPNGTTILGGLREALGDARRDVLRRPARASTRRSTTR